MRSSGLANIRRGAVLAALLAALCAGRVDGADAWELTIKVYGSGTVEETRNPDDRRQRCGSLFAATGEDGLQHDCMSSGNLYCGLCDYSIFATAAPGFTFSRYEWVRPDDIGWSERTSSWRWAAGAAGDFEVKAFFVDDAEPDTTITGGPAEGAFVSSTSAAFDLGTTQAFGAGTYVCSLNGTLIGCGHPLNLTSLTDGPKTLLVQAKDPSNNTDSSAASRSWTVDTAPPLTTLSGGPVDGSHISARSVSFDITVNEPATLACTLNGASIACAPGPLALTSLPDGAYTLSVRATDRAGNNQQSPVTRMWSVDTVVPDADGDGVLPPGDCNDADPHVFPGAAELPGNGVDDDCADGDAGLVDGDGDTHFNHMDRCPTIAGGPFDADADGCPGPFGRISISSTATWSEVTRKGVKLTGVVVADAPRGARVQVVCPGRRRCRFAQSRVSRGKRITLKHFSGRRLAPGARFAIKVTEPGMIGDYMLRRVNRPRPGRAGLAKFRRDPITKVRRCIPEGATKPRKTCSTVVGP